MDLASTLDQLSRELHARVSLRCETDNLEVVYVERQPDGALLVTDRGQTWSYLVSSRDPTFDRTDLTDDALHEIASRHHVRVVGSTTSEGGVRLEAQSERDHLSRSVDQVSQAIDEVFSIALRHDLRSG